MLLESYTDWLGNKIQVGDLIVYPGRQSSSLWMNHARVLEISERHTYYGVHPIMKVMHTDKSQYGRMKDKVVIITKLQQVTKV